MRNPVVAGSFYPATKEELQKTLDEFFAKVKKRDLKGKVIAGIVPHAGYPYSGAVASEIFVNLPKECSTIIIIGPKHALYKEGIFVYPKGKWKTPLGELEVDEKIASELIKRGNGIIKGDYEVHEDEHSIEVELPFIQKVLPHAKIVPIAVSTQKYDHYTILGKAIAWVAENYKNIVILASTDLYHGYSYEECIEQDKRFIQYVKALNYKGLFSALQRGETMACGEGGVIALLYALNRMGIKTAELLKYTNSSDVIGIRGGYVVGYLALVFLKEEKEDTLSLEEKKELIKIARESIKRGLKGEKWTPPEPSSPDLKNFQGAFVTLKKRGMLRGCIGYVEPIKPLYLTVADVAYSASFADPRFPPLSKEEYDEIELEITVLSPLKKIDNPELVEVGKHGLLVKRGIYQGLLLPQVPVEEGWDRETFLRHTCLKAGLPPDAWKDPETELYIFTGEIFSEKKIK